MARPPEKEPLTTDFPQFREQDPVLWFKLRPNVTVDNKTSRAGRLIYENTYTMDGESRRETPRDTSAPPERVASLRGFRSRRGR